MKANRIFISLAILGAPLLSITGCAMGLSQYQSPTVQNTPMGATYNPIFSAIPNGDTFPLKLDSQTVRALGSVSFKSYDNGVIQDLRSRFRTAGDYPILSLIPNVTFESSTDTDVQIYGTSTAVSTTNAMADLAGYISGGDNSGDILLELNTAGSSVGEFKWNVYDSDTAGIQRSMQTAQAIAFSIAAAKLVEDLEQARDELDRIHANFIMNMD